MAHSPKHEGNDAQPTARFEDHLLDPDASEQEREQTLADASDDAAMAARLIDRQFVHGLLVSEADATSVGRARRLRAAMRAIPDSPQATVTRVVPRTRWRVWAAAAALLVGVGIAVWAVGGRDANVQPGGGGEANAPTPVLTPSYRVLGGSVTDVAADAGHRMLTTATDAGATVRFGRNLAVLAPGSNLMVDASGLNFELRSGAASFEGEGIRARVDGRVAEIWGGPVVIARNGGESVDLFSGRMTDEAGSDLLAAGQTYNSAIGKTLPLSLSELPDWVANGRAEDVFAELDRISGGRLKDQREAWIESLRPLLAEPVTRSSIQSATLELLDGSLTPDEVQGVLEILSAGLSAFKRMAEEKGKDFEEEITMLARRIAANQSRISDEVRELHRKQRDALLRDWRKLSAEERSKLKFLILSTLERMGRAQPKAEPDDEGTTDD